MAQIDYAPPPAPFLRRPKVWRFLRRAAIAAGCVFILLWTPFLVRNIMRVIWQWECLNHTASPGAIALEYVDGEVTRAHPSEQPDMTPLLPMTISPRLDERVVFLHERHLPGGAKRLVVIWLYARMGTNRVEAQVIDMSPFQAERIRSTTSFVFPEICGGIDAFTRGTFRLYEGQPDDNDPTHFTIRFERDQIHGVIDGRLTKTQSVSLELRQE